MEYNLGTILLTISTSNLVASTLQYGILINIKVTLSGFINHEINKLIKI